MNAELKSYIKECNCPEIQNGWKPKVGDKIADNFPPLSDKWEITVVDKELKKGLVIQNVIFLPSLEQLIAMMGWGRFHKMFNGWFEQERPLDLLDRSTQKLKLACIKVVKEIKTENK